MRKRNLQNLVLPTGRLFLIAALLNAVSLPASAAVVVSDAARSTGQFHIRQERQAASGVLVSRPKADDIALMRFLVRENLHSVEDYARWLRQNLHYKQDTDGDIWQKPLQTLTVRTGDCEDFAFLTEAVGRVLGHRPALLAFVRKGQAHAVCVMKINGRFIWFDNEKLLTSGAATLVELARDIAEDYHYAGSLVFHPEKHEWAVIYQNETSS